jgi:hypothetical protein
LKEGKYCTYTDHIIFLKDTPHIKFINSSSPSLTEGAEKIVKGDTGQESLVKLVME